MNPPLGRYIWGRATIALAIVIALSGGGARASSIREATSFGHSVRGVDLRAINIGARTEKTRILLFGCVHGNECAGKAILRELRDMKSPRGFELWLVGDLNPDGSSRGTRHNARGVDLNRNFPTGWQGGGSRWDTYYPGPRPRSEPETRAAMRLVKAIKPDITIWYHQRMALVTKRRRHSWVPRRYARLVGLPLERLPRLPGTASRWQNRAFPGHVSFVVELPAGRMSARSARRHADAVRALGRLWGNYRS